MYLVAIMNGYSRQVLAWRVSNSLDTDFCVEALKGAIQKHGTPEIFNTDQGAQFTSLEFINLLKQNDIRISMDGRGWYQDNIFIERLWWTVKYQYLYLHTFEGVSDLRKGLKSWFEFYNQERPHQTHGGNTPDEVYGGRGNHRGCLRPQFNKDQSLELVSGCPDKPEHHKFFLC